MKNIYVFFYLFIPDLIESDLESAPLQTENYKAFPVTIKSLAFNQSKKFN